MKNTIKKFICTTIAAVSLSAIVTVPPSLNTPTSDNNTVNSIEAEAATRISYAKRLVSVKQRGNIRAAASKNSKDLGDVEVGQVLPVFEETPNWVRITDNGAPKPKYVAKKLLNDKDCTFKVTVRFGPPLDFYYTPGGKESGRTLTYSPYRSNSITAYNVAIEYFGNSFILWCATDTNPQYRRWVRPKLYDNKSSRFALLREDAQIDEKLNIQLWKQLNLLAF